MGSNAAAVPDSPSVKLMAPSRYRPSAAMSSDPPVMPSAHPRNHGVHFSAPQHNLFQQPSCDDVQDFTVPTKEIGGRSVGCLEPRFGALG
jgi:hypothetical protein